MKTKSKVWDDFMSSEFAQKRLEKQAADRSEYNVDPKNKTVLNPSVETKGVNSGGASMVGSGDSKALYTTKPVSVPGGAEKYADPVVEGLEDIHNAMLDVAHSTPTGKVAGTKPFMKAAQFEDEMSDEIEVVEDEDKLIEQFLTDLESEDDEDDQQQDLVSLLEQQDVEDQFAPEENEVELVEEQEGLGSVMASKKTLLILKELVASADELDAAGRTEDADVLDAVIKQELQTMVTASKKK
jgi:hypothetical protein